ncbi:MAG: nitrile hydratase subunit beta [Candidatus Eremiobacteraeota bacterium]|nr:nitrile hydratase subunit beta [Candidatus Eremiobacteraeota bacterium]
MTLVAGTRVRTREQRTGGHTRLPRYLQHAQGVVVASLGSFPLPDAVVANPNDPRQSELYTVAFPAWSIFPDGDNGTICADLFEEYLETES